MPPRSARHMTSRASLRGAKTASNGDGPRGGRRPTRGRRGPSLRKRLVHRFRCLGAGLDGDFDLVCILQEMEPTFEENLVANEKEGGKVAGRGVGRAPGRCGQRKSSRLRRELPTGPRASLPSVWHLCASECYRESARERCKNAFVRQAFGLMPGAHVSSRRGFPAALGRLVVCAASGIDPK